MTGSAPQADRPDGPRSPWVQVPAPAARAAAPTGRVRAVVIAGASTVLALVVVPLPWLVQRLLRIDPLGARPGWVRRRHRGARPARPWGRDPALEAPPLGPRVRGRVAALSVLALLVVSTPAGRALVPSLTGPPDRPSNPFRLIPPGQGDQPGPGGPGAIPTLEEPVDPDLRAHAPAGAAHDGEAWWAEPAYSVALNHLLDPRVGWRPVNPYRLLDVSSPHINVVDGRRSSWVPPPCSCERLTVWIYGGSTTFGLDQRDDHTIASELARMAAQDGVTVDVHNRGQLGQLHWAEAERFAWDLTVDDAPDLVLFYDGVNDRTATNLLNDNDPLDVKPMEDMTLMDVWSASGRSEGALPPGPSGSRLLGRPTGPRLDIRQLSQTTVARYQRARRLSRATAEAHHIPVRYYWQPSRVSRPVVLREPHDNARGEDRLRLSEQLTRSFLPDDVTDLTDVFDGTTEPLFTDDVHHNEKGARIVAEAIYADIETQLQALRGG
ncbi:MAG: hypothetical protein JWM47_980 [Acidimicrobiales bacterium]|nr:hypothetical protein [Acidimicrobiales bacterium]